MLADKGTVNQLLRAVGLGDATHVWLGDRATALNAVGVIGFWLQLGFCVVLLLSGIGNIDQSLYEAASLDGAGWWRQLFYITLPGLRGQIGVCLTMTIIAALASFDVVYMSTQGGPGTSTMVPGVQVYRLAFTQQSVGLASALAVALMVLVLLIVGPLQRLVNGRISDCDGAVQKYEGNRRHHARADYRVLHHAFREYVFRGDSTARFNS